MRVTKEEMTRCLVTGQQFHLRCDSLTDAADDHPSLRMDVIPIKANVNNLKASGVLYRLCSPIAETVWIAGSLEEACVCAMGACESYSLTVSHMEDENESTVPELW
jgi:hypothetical protein